MHHYRAPLTHTGTPGGEAAGTDPVARYDHLAVDDAPLHSAKRVGGVGEDLVGRAIISVVATMRDISVDREQGGVAGEVQRPAGFVIDAIPDAFPA